MSNRLLELRVLDFISEHVDAITVQLGNFIVAIDIEEFLVKKPSEYQIGEITMFTSFKGGSLVAEVNGILILRGMASEYKIACDVEKDRHLILFYLAKSDLDYHVLMAMVEKIGISFGEVSLDYLLPKE